MKRVTPLSRPRSRPFREEGPLTPKEWRASVLLPQMCAVCKRTKVHLEGHHVIPKQMLRRDRRFDLVWDPLNGIPACRKCHSNHETAYRRIPRSVLSPANIDWAEIHGYGWVIERYYPEVPDA